MTPRRAPSHDGLWLLGALGMIVFVSPLRLVWSGDGAPWYGAFVVWGLFIGAAALAMSHGARDGDG